MGGGPPRTVVTVRAESLAGRTMRVCARTGAAELLGDRHDALPRAEAAIAKDGLPPMLALVYACVSRDRRWTSVRALEHAARRAAGGQPRSTDDGTERDLERMFSEARAKAGIPDRLGVFAPAPKDGLSSAVPPLDLITSLAVLAHRSGNTFLPRRRIHASLITLWDGLLLFPEEP